MVSAVSKDTIARIAMAGPEAKVRAILPLRLNSSCLPLDLVLHYHFVEIKAYTLYINMLFISTCSESHLHIHAHTQLKMLQALGIQNVLITDGKSPVNLFQSPQGITQMPGRY